MAKSSKLEHQSRLRVVQEWILEDHSFRDIVKSIVAKWDLSERQAERYYSDAYQLFAEGEVANIDRKKFYYIQRKKKLIKEMNPLEKKTAAGVTAINRVLDSMAEIEGIKSGNKIEISDKDGLTIKIGYGQKETEI